MKSIAATVASASVFTVVIAPASCKKEAPAPSGDIASSSDADSPQPDEPAPPDDPHFEDLWSDMDDGVVPRGTGADDDDPYSGPEFTIDVLVMESFPEQYAALFKVTTNTGGWNLTLDRTAWEGGAVKAYLTLEAPGSDEMVTQALEDHEARFAAGTKKIERAEAHVRLTRRGEGGVQPYRLAATTE